MQPLKQRAHELPDIGPKIAAFSVLPEWLAMMRSCKVLQTAVNRFLKDLMVEAARQDRRISPAHLVKLEGIKSGYLRQYFEERSEGVARHRFTSITPRMISWQVGEKGSDSWDDRGPVPQLNSSHLLIHSNGRLRLYPLSAGGEPLPATVDQPSDNWSVWALDPSSGDYIERASRSFAIKCSIGETAQFEGRTWPLCWLGEGYSASGFTCSGPYVACSMRTTTTPTSFDEIFFIGVFDKRRFGSDNFRRLDDGEGRHAARQLMISGHHLVCALMQKGYAYVWNLTESSPTRFKLDHGEGYDAMRAACGQGHVVTVCNQWVKLWEAGTGKQLKAVRLGEATSLQPMDLCLCFPFLALTRGERSRSGNRVSNLSIVDLREGRLIRSLPLQGTVGSHGRSGPTRNKSPLFLDEHKVSYCNVEGSDCTLMGLNFGIRPASDEKKKGAGAGPGSGGPGPGPGTAAAAAALD